MKNKFRSLLAILLAFVMVAMMVGTSTVNAAIVSDESVGATQSEAVNWVNSKIGTWIGSGQCVALINSLNSNNQELYGERIKQSILFYLDQLKIAYSIVTDEDGIFIFPKGVPEFDDALVSAPLDWLKDYPNAEKAWSKALRAYSEAIPDDASDVADLFRKALETFFQEFFKTGDGRTLENSKTEYGKYLKANGIPAEVSNNLETLLQAYTNYMSNYAKHTNRAKINVLEYLMYQTGNIIRLVITLQQEATE